MTSPKEAAGLPIPGAAPTSSPGRLVGRFARVTVSDIGTLLCFDWEFNTSTDFADGTAHGDYWEQPVQLRHSWTFRARGYMTYGGVGNTTYAGAGWSATDVAAMTITLYSSLEATPKVILTLSGFPARGTFSAPMAMVTQEIEFRGVGAPTIATS